MDSRPNIPWVRQEEFINLYNDKVAKLLAAKEIMPIEFCEVTLPEIFLQFYNLIRRALVDCGKIRETFDDKFSDVLIKSFVEI